MTFEDFRERCSACIEADGYLSVPLEELQARDPQEIQMLLQLFGNQALIKLPNYEVEFFEWLKQEDATVWDDLWQDDDVAPYLVSLAHVYSFTNPRGSYAIRDLRNTDNYYFAPEMILAKESTAYLGAVRERFTRNESLTPAQLLALEASVGPVDIWHLAYHRGIPIESLKKAVKQLVEDQVLVHVPNADHLATIFDVQ